MFLVHNVRATISEQNEKDGYIYIYIYIYVEKPTNTK